MADYSIEDKISFITCDVKCYGRKLKRKIQRRLNIPVKPTKKTYGHDFKNIDIVQSDIADLLDSGIPFMVGRMGGVESLAVLESIRIEMGLKKSFSPIIAEKAQMNAGFFPTTIEMFSKFSSLIEDSIKSVDVLGSMVTNNEEFLLKRNLKPTAVMTDIGNLEPYYSSTPWSSHLRGKKVLVIYPFADTIKEQYKKRRDLFSNANVLPEFELKVLKSVQSIAGTKTDFETWFDALDYMYNEAMQIDFDVALIGCGAYGFPLAARIKQSGKQAIHLGGAVQILFGVWGSRWESIPQVRCLKNDSWVRPSDNERPTNADKVENACYW